MYVGAESDAVRAWFVEKQNLFCHCESRVGVTGCSTVLCVKL